MNRKSKFILSVAAAFIIAFAAWTLLLRIVDVQAIGPEGSEVGFATFNQLLRDLIGVNMTLYTLTDWLGILPIAVALCFALLGLVQWIRRKSILKVDRSIMILGGFYVAVMAVYIFFELVEINYRPVLINSVLETSYPSSTTMLACCVMPTAIMQFDRLVRAKWLRVSLSSTSAAFTAFMVIGRALSGVHWATDIIGGLLVSAGLVLTYYALSEPDGKK